MKHIGIVKPDILVNLLNFIGVSLAALYFFSMFIYPWIIGECDWNFVLNTWDRWQSLNVGMLAFISSITAFNISRFNANKQRERDFAAEKAFLPATLSELTSYFKASASILSQAWDTARGQPLEAELPTPGNNYREVFKQCIRYADPEVGEYLSYILMRLQVHDSRLREFITQFNDNNYINPDRHNIIVYIYRLGELQALINKLFEFSRSLGDFDRDPLEWEDYRNAYSNLDFWIEDYSVNEDMNLTAFTQRAIKRNDHPNS